MQLSRQMLDDETLLIVFSAQSRHELAGSDETKYLRLVRLHSYVPVCLLHTTFYPNPRSQSVFGTLRRDRCLLTAGAKMASTPSFCKRAASVCKLLGYCSKFFIGSKLGGIDKYAYHGQIVFPDKIFLPGLHGPHARRPWLVQVRFVPH